MSDQEMATPIRDDHSKYTELVLNWPSKNGCKIDFACKFIDGAYKECMCYGSVCSTLYNHYAFVRLHLTNTERVYAHLKKYPDKDNEEHIRQQFFIEHQILTLNFEFFCVQNFSAKTFQNF